MWHTFWQIKFTEAFQLWTLKQAFAFKPCDDYSVANNDHAYSFILLLNLHLSYSAKNRDAKTCG